MQQLKEEIYNEMKLCSGPHISHINNTNSIRDKVDLYSTFHFDNFLCLNGLRKTLVRFEEFRIPELLEGKTVIDLGSNIGGMSFECLRRKAENVKGFEYNQDRVNVCNKLLNYLGLSDKGNFEQLDINELLKDSTQFKYTADIVICCAIDAYITNKQELYKLVGTITNEVCYYETNSGIHPDDFKKEMEKYFRGIIHLGTSKSDAGFGRHSYILLKTDELLSERYNGKNEYDHTVFKENDKIKIRFYNRDIFERVKRLMLRLNDCIYVPKCEFIQPDILKMELLDDNYKLGNLSLSLEDKLIIKRQIVDFIKTMNSNKLAHRDLHIGNIYYINGIIKIIDWEFVIEEDRPIDKMYDLTGIGDSPLNSGNMCILHQHSQSLCEYLKPEIVLSIKDFL